MRLWTIQPLNVWEQLQTNKVFRCEVSLAKCMNELKFKSAYQWMTVQMRRRIGEPPPGVTTPIWAWHTFNWQRKKPDLRRTEFHSYRGKHVCIEFEIPSEQALLSDEVEWHHVLNDIYFPTVSNGKDFEAAWQIFESLTEEEQRKLKEKSWEQIFDIAPINNDWCQTGRYLQATFWELKMEQVQSVRYFGR